MALPRRTSRTTTKGLPGAAAMLLVLVAAVITGFAAAADAKTPGRSYCFLGRCHRVLTLAETRSRLGRTETLRASFYDDCARDRFNPCTLTSSGEAFRPRAPDNAASPIYPDGTMLLLFYPETGAAAVVRINNAGPYHTSRLIDVSVATADALGFRSKGLADLEVRVIAVPRPEEATYRKLRRYWPVHGPIGTHGSIGEAHTALVRVSELPRAPARPDAALLVSLPITEIAAAASPADGELVTATAQHAPVPGLEPVRPDALLVHAPPERADWLRVVAPGEPTPAPPAAVQIASWTLRDVTRRDELTRQADARGVLATLRARARHGLKPGSLPEVRLDAAIAWLRDAAVSLAQHARTAARSRIVPRSPPRLVQLGSLPDAPGTISPR